MINYSNSKLCNILMSNELAEKLRGANVISNSLHPGAIRTQVLRNIQWYGWLVMWLPYMFFFKVI